MLKHTMERKGVGYTSKPIPIGIQWFETGLWTYHRKT